MKTETQHHRSCPFKSAESHTWLILIAALLLPDTASSQNPEWIVYNKSNSGLADNRAPVAMLDPQGCLLVGHSHCCDPNGGGFSKFDGVHWTVYNTRNSGLPHNNVFGFAFDPKGNTWIGTGSTQNTGGGLAKFDGKTWTTYHTGNSPLPNNNILSLKFDAKGNLWIATFGGGVAKFDGEDWTVYNTQNSGLPGNTVSGIAFDSAGNVWMLTWGDGGLARFDGVNWKRFSVQSTMASSIAIDSKDNVWVGSENAGALKISGNDLTFYTASNTKMPITSSWFIAIDSKDNVWICTGASGLVKYDGSEWTLYNTKNSMLPSDILYSLSEDVWGNKWIATSNDGVAVYRAGGVLFPPATSILALNTAVGQAISAHDVDAIVSFMAPDAVFDFAPVPPMLVGPTAIGGFFSGLFHGFPDYNTTSEQRWLSGNAVVTAHTTSGTLRNPWMGMPATGKGGDHMHLDVWEYQDDKLQRITTYMDLQSLMVVTGLMPAPQLPVLQPVTPMADPAPTGLSPVAAVDEGLSRWNAHNLAEFAKILRGDAQVLFALLGAPLDRPSAIAMMELFYQGFGDLKFDVARHLDLGEGWVLTEGVYRGTNSGPYLGLPATGRAVEVRAALLNQVDNQGLICAERVYFDNISALTQLGYFPPSPRLSFQRTAKGMIITYEGSLLSAPSVTAPWHLVGGASSPHTVTATNGPMFFKAQQ